MSLQALLGVVRHLVVERIGVDVNYEVVRHLFGLLGSGWVELAGLRHPIRPWQERVHNLIGEIMNTVVTGWKPFSNPRMFAGYGRQKGWERDTSGNELPSNEGGFVELSEEECRQLELPQEWIA